MKIANPERVVTQDILMLSPRQMNGPSTQVEILPPMVEEMTQLLQVQVSFKEIYYGKKINNFT